MRRCRHAWQDYCDGKDPHRFLPDFMRSSGSIFAGRPSNLPDPLSVSSAPISHLLEMNSRDCFSVVGLKRSARLILVLVQGLLLLLGQGPLGTPLATACDRGLRELDASG
jgi:hypothetical protein